MIQLALGNMSRTDLRLSFLLARRRLFRFLLIYSESYSIRDLLRQGMEIRNLILQYFREHGFEAPFHSFVTSLEWQCYFVLEETDYLQAFAFHLFNFMKSAGYTGNDPQRDVMDWNSEATESDSPSHFYPSDTDIEDDPFE